MRQTSHIICVWNLDMDENGFRIERSALITFLQVLWDVYLYINAQPFSGVDLILIKLT